ncbi:hypothetical protein DDB_G0282249 [Dictyostelium discoideum AX4]|uniref:hypothetical protein n=1 Tax=Dictyostelium discoideum AX4 TaxID=352472 RepID=UPI00004E3DF9|nr:hypothetical protein DDB_G0282249 [Dictyostelium discoideum AX4]EAL66330.1 hypothetical protein DDB_G0282249 [Dictyostelium discoideum AX4]|eukprot:XP_640308.1 hypothetical protein DDB_G0282249 [Dictyostelium discoideum AX4]
MEIYYNNSLKKIYKKVQIPQEIKKKKNLTKNRKQIKKKNNKIFIYIFNNPISKNSNLILCIFGVC